MAWVVERIAEQRLLWNLRGQTAATAAHPQDMTFEQVMTLVRRKLQRDYDRHRLWLVIDTLGLIASGAADAGARVRTSWRTTSRSAWSVTGCRCAAPRRACTASPGPAGRVRRSTSCARWRCSTRMPATCACTTSPPVSACSTWPTFFARVIPPKRDPETTSERPVRKDRPYSDSSAHRTTSRPDFCQPRARRHTIGRSEAARTCRAPRVPARRRRRHRHRGVAGIQDAAPGDITFLANPKYEKTLRRHPAPRRSSCATTRRPRRARCCARAIRISPSPAPSASSPRPGGRPPASIRLRPWPRTRGLARRCRSAPSSRSARRRRIGDRTVDLSQRHHRAGRAHRQRLRHPFERRASASASRSATASSCRTASSSAATATASSGAATARTRRSRRWRRWSSRTTSSWAPTRPWTGRRSARRASVPATKIDNLVQIAHGVTIGRNVLMAAQVGIAGSTELGDDVIFGGQVGVGGHLTIGRGAIAVGQSGVTNSLDAGARWSPATRPSTAATGGGVGRFPPSAGTEAPHRRAGGARGRTDGRATAAALEGHPSDSMSLLATIVIVASAAAASAGNPASHLPPIASSSCRAPIFA